MGSWLQLILDTKTSTQPDLYKCLVSGFENQDVMVDFYSRDVI